MSMTVYIQLTAVGADAGPSFDLYSNGNSYASAFATDVDKTVLLAGETYANVADGSTIIRVINHDNQAKKVIEI